MRYAKNNILIGIIVVALLLLVGYSYFNKGHISNQPAQQKEVIRLEGSQPTDLPFSPAIKVGNMMFLSGSIGTDTKTGKLVSDNVEEQTRQTMENLRTLLRQGEMDFADVVRATVYLADINDYAKMNKVYATYFSKDSPARACVEVAGLVRGAKVEISMIAIKSK